MDSGYSLSLLPDNTTHVPQHEALTSATYSPWSYQDGAKSPTSRVFRRESQRSSRGYERLGHPQPQFGFESSAPQLIAKPSKSSQWLWWLPELFASFLACACLVAIVIVLRVYDGKPLSSVVLPASLTLNGIIAAISTLARVALMVPIGSAMSQEAWLWFSKNANDQHRSRSRLKDLDLADAASRGAWGSLTFIFLGRGRWIAYFATILTIVSLVFGTATQQLLATDKIIVTDASLLPGNLPRAETWQYFDSNPAESTPTPPFHIRAAMYNGFLSNTTDPVTVSCPTGNCTWPITSSLAVCGGCAASTYTKTCNTTACLYHMPSGNYMSLNSTAEVGEGYGFRVATNYKGGTSFNASLNDRVYLTNFDMVGASYMTLESGFNNTNVNASECALWMCVQSYNSSVLAGVLQENVTMSFSNLARPENETQGGFDNYTFAALPAAMNPDANVTYNVSLLGLMSLGGNFDKMCTGYGFLDTESSFASSDTIDAIWHASSDPDPWIKGLATSITNAIRVDNINPVPPSRYELVAAPQRALYDGSAYQLGIRVQWPWLVLPIICVAGAILLLAWVMIETYRSPVVPWKASLITFLFFDVDPALKRQATHAINQRRGIFDSVGDSKAVLVEDATGRWTVKAA